VARNDNDTTDRRKAGAVAAAIRTRTAHLVWLVCAACALLLAVGALMVALGANKDNGLVDFVLRAADAVDLGVFSRQDGIWQFDSEGAKVKNALVNWGLGAIAWLIVGRVLDRIIKP
jgi:stage V sporulation protein SpoVS